MEHGSIKNSFLFVSLLACLFFVVLSGCGVTDTERIADPANPSQPTLSGGTSQPTPRATFTPAQATLQALGREYDSLAKTQIAHPELKQLGPTMDALKQRFDELVYALPSPTRPTQSNIMAGTASPEPIPIPTAEPYPTHPPVIGITKDCESGFAHYMDITNCWFGSIDTKRVAIFAGHMENNDQQGVIVILPKAGPRSESYKTATQHGALTITEVTGTRFKLTAQDGTVFIFDAAKRAWEAPDTK